MKQILKIIGFTFIIALTFILCNSEKSYASVTTSSSATITTSSACVLLEPETDYTILNKDISVDLTLNNVENITAADITIYFDNDKLQFTDYTETQGIKIVHQDKNLGILRIVCASLGKDNAINSKKVIAHLNFKTIKEGKALFYVQKAKLADGVELEKSLKNKEMGSTLITINNSDFVDVNNDGTFTLQDLAIEAKHLNENPKLNDTYNLDVFTDGKTNESDLFTISRKMFDNKDYSN